jgi:N-methylhydantoinase A/oxoprolinase/acetone carboxylase beta subunit/N-methylhydantoinase B/oxoprolinase/acetone carboxylase alpha subunit
VSEGRAAGVDVGGTFTDVVVVEQGGGTLIPRAVKTPTTPADQGEGVLNGLDDSARDGVAHLAHGTTTATNAILERDVARTVLVTTRGFADLLVIGRQARPALYDLTVTRPAPLVPSELVVTVEERVAHDGSVVIALTDAEITRVVESVEAAEPESVAVSLLFSYADDEHERRLCAALEERLNVPVTRSSALLPEFREYERASTCVLNAAVAPRMRRYLSGLDDRLPQTTISVMMSGGGTTDLAYAAEAPVHTLLSGPAAGVVAAGAIAAAAGFGDAVGFDMGGTSTDVCLIRDGRPDISSHSTIDRLPFRTPAVAIHTVGAGGGSIAWIDQGGALRVGPRSAGADPGPACYGKGGTEPTVTDAHCVLGHLDPNRQLGGGLTLDVDTARRVVDTLPEQADGASGILTVVRATMARALRKVSTERGVDPGELALLAYGGAGPLHATALAREVGMRAVIVPPAAGVLSALGLLLAPPRAEASRTLMVDAGDDIGHVWTELSETATRQLAAQGAAGDPTVRHIAECRYAGQSHELRVDADGDPGARFHEAHEEAYGYRMPDEQVQLVTARVIAEGTPVLPAPPGEWEQERRDEDTRRIVVDGSQVDARVVSRGALAPGDTVDGPALVEQSDTTTLLAPGDHATIDDHHNLIITAGGERTLSAVQLEVVRHALAGVADEMGAALRRAAYSPNIKERADCSAAVFAPDGQMVAQAEHIPVHLGAMPRSVEAAIDRFGDRLTPGTQVMVNDPYAGGTHLPDLTLVAAVGDADGTLLGYVANRAHHADVGGAAPGSMPANATDIAMEGLRIPPIVLAEDGRVRDDLVELIAANSRTPRERHGDLRAQFAANHVGAQRLRELAVRYGIAGLHTAMREVCDYSERRVRAAITDIPDGEYRARDVLELPGADGTDDEVEIRVTLTVDGDEVTADFAGSGAQVPANVNAVLAVTASSAYFVLRMLTDPDAPPNAGCYRPLTVRAPARSVVDARHPAPVAAGNVETSQRIVDVLLAAFARALPDRVPAASQGTMNNLLLGASDPVAFSYYETLGGGEGATPGRDGQSGIHTGMTNTENTPAEAIELDYPLRIWCYELRPDSGGDGDHRGGDGLVREIEVLSEHATLTLQTERRLHAPWGLHGGGDGASGRNVLIRAGGAEEDLASKGTWRLERGDRVRIETPGGGGWNPPAREAT